MSVMKTLKTAALVISIVAGLAAVVQAIAAVLLVIRPP